MARDFKFLREEHVLIMCKQFALALLLETSLVTCPKTVDTNVYFDILGNDNDVMS